MTEPAYPRLQHIVLMRFPVELAADEDQELRGLMLSLPSDIEQLLACRFGSDLDGSRTEGYHYLLYTEFRDTDALREYVEHPSHQVVVRWLDAHGCRRLAFDYYFDRPQDVIA